jgi:hypothetical protein
MKYDLFANFPKVIKILLDSLLEQNCFATLAEKKSSLQTAQQLALNKNAFIINLFEPVAVVVCVRSTLPPPHPPTVKKQRGGILLKGEDLKGAEIRVISNSPSHSCQQIHTHAKSACTPGGKRNTRQVL